MGKKSGPGQVHFNLWSSNNVLMKVTPVLFLTNWPNAHDK